MVNGGKGDESGRGEEQGGEERIDSGEVQGKGKGKSGRHAGALSAGGWRIAGGRARTSGIVLFNHAP